MNKLFNSLSNINIRKNDGYTFIAKDEVYIPIIQTYLLITKRSFYKLPLLDEIVLRLINEGVQEIESLVAILGIKRTLLEVTLADLNVKDIIYCTNNRCSLMAKGREALRDLKTIQRRKDILKNVYLDPINNKVLVDYQNYQFLEKVYDSDKKLNADFDIDSVEVFKKNIDKINTLFSDEMNIYNDKTKAEPDELLSIDGIDNLYPKFIRLPIYIYVSNTGYDIDILSVRKNDDTLINDFKNTIIEQIRERKLLKNIFLRHELSESYQELPYNEDPEINKILFNYKRNVEDREILSKVLEEKVFCNRKMFDEEFDILFSYFLDKSKAVEINISNLNDLIRNKLFNYVLSSIDKKLEAVNFAECYNLETTLYKLKRFVPACENKIHKLDKKYYFSVIFDDTIKITCIPKDVKVIDGKTHIYKNNFYLTYN